MSVRIESARMAEERKPYFASDSMQSIAKEIAEYISTNKSPSYQYRNRTRDTMRSLEKIESAREEAAAAERKALFALTHARTCADMISTYIREKQYAKIPRFASSIGIAMEAYYRELRIGSNARAIESVEYNKMAFESKRNNDEVFQRFMVAIIRV